jgi:hypothetical protein
MRKQKIQDGRKIIEGQSDSSVGMPGADGMQGCSTLWNAEEVEEAIEAADGGAEAILGE